MPQENETFQVTLHLSNESKQHLLRHFPTGNIHVASVEIDARIDGEIDQLSDQPVCLKL